MTTVTAPAYLADQLREITELVEVRDEAGQTIGYFQSLAIPNQEAMPKTPYSVEELQQLRQQRTGKPLSEILDRLERSHPS
ncbi:MAG TPA: hypothetical protein VGZ47_07225 [Gemmataceae bacterium]|jgi:hypothetical protein|nr:hypothetical protein [Gemmataceae bacterium]